MKWMHEENGALPINSWCAEVEEGAMIQAKTWPVTRRWRITSP